MLQILSKNLKRLQEDAVEMQTSTIVMAWLSSTIYCIFLDFYDIELVKNAQNDLAWNRERERIDIKQDPWFVKTYKQTIYKFQ